MCPLTTKRLTDANLSRATRAVRDGMTYREAQRKFCIARSTMADNLTRQNRFEAGGAVNRHGKKPVFLAEEKNVHATCSQSLATEGRLIGALIYKKLLSCSSRLFLKIDKENYRSRTVFLEADFCGILRHGTCIRSSFRSTASGSEAIWCIECRIFYNSLRYAAQAVRWVQIQCLAIVEPGQYRIHNKPPICFTLEEKALFDEKQHLWHESRWLLLGPSNNNATDRQWDRQRWTDCHCF